jgi:hypothetical protein
VLDHHAAVEADFAHYYPGVDLADLWHGRLSWRRVGVLLAGLPTHGTALARALTGTDAGEWTVTDYLLAEVVDAARLNVWATAQVNSTRRIKQPDPLPRPGDGDAGSSIPGSSRAAVRAFFSGPMRSGP